MNRDAILAKATEYTMSDRNAQYGDPGEQMALAGELKALIRAHAKRDILPAELEALDSVLLKISRAVIGPDPGIDTYIDMAAYAAIAGEARYGKKTKFEHQVRVVPHFAPQGRDATPRMYGKAEIDV